MSLFTVQTIFWFIFAISALHVAEEYAAGWVKFVNSFPNPIGHTTMGTFYLVNGVFISLCMLGALLNTSFIIFSLSIAALLFVNAIIHLGGTVRFRRYTPGVATAAIFYFPFSLYSYYLYGQAGLLTETNLVLSAVLGIGWMGLAVIYGFAAARRMKRAK